MVKKNTNITKQNMDNFFHSRHSTPQLQLDKYILIYHPFNNNNNNNKIQTKEEEKYKGKRKKEPWIKYPFLFQTVTTNAMWTVYEVTGFTFCLDTVGHYFVLWASVSDTCQCVCEYWMTV